MSIFEYNLAWKARKKIAKSQQDNFCCKPMGHFDCHNLLSGS